jgi:hypothetical protein
MRLAEGTEHDQLMGLFAGAGNARSTGERWSGMLENEDR